VLRPSCTFMSFVVDIFEFFYAPHANVSGTNYCRVTFELFCFPREADISGNTSHTPSNLTK